VVTANTIGTNYEYRVRDWFNDQGWKAERNPLSGASEQIVSEMGKHDIRTWREDLKVFLQVECKKTGKANNILNLEQEWLDKIDFDEDEILCFSYKNCKEHFCLTTKEVAQKVMKNHDMKLTEEVYSPKGKKQCVMKRIWLEKKIDQLFQIKFNNKMYYIMNLEMYLRGREGCGPTKDYEFLKSRSDSNSKYELVVLEISKWVKSVKCDISQPQLELLLDRIAEISGVKK
jgi:hypothetical protein